MTRNAETVMYDTDLIASKMEIKSGPAIESIWDKQSVNKALEIVEGGGPIGFCGLGIYGLGGIPRAFIERSHFPTYGELPSIGELKGRNFYSSPSVAMASWPVLERLVSWEAMSGSDVDLKRPEVINTVKEAFHALPWIFVLPVTQEAAEVLPFTQKKDKSLAHAFLCTGAYAPWVNMAEEIERRTRQVILVTSANYHNSPPLVSAEEVAKSFPQLPLILSDPKFEEKGEQWFSHNMYDLTKFPEEVAVLRLGNEAHEIFVNFLQQRGFSPRFVFDFLGEEKILTKTPPINSLEKFKFLVIFPRKIRSKNNS